MKKLSTTNLMLLAMVLAMFTAPAFAQQTFGDSAKGIFTQFKDFADVITAGVFLAGLAIGAAAAFKFKAHSENAQQVPLKIPLIYSLVAAICIGLPAFLNMGRNTIFEDGESNNMNEGVYDSIGR